MFEKIIWATDGSEAADRALEVAKSVASQSGATLLAVHTVEYMVGKGEIPVAFDDDEQVLKVKKQVAELTHEGLQANARVAHGHMSGAAHTIAEVAQEEGADLIVVGTRGHTRLGGLLLGSVTQRLLAIADVPVLVVPTHKK